MGWLGWPPDLVYATDVNVIDIAVHGRIDMLNAIFGSTKPQQSGGFTIEQWRARVKAHNIAHAGKQKGRRGGRQ